MKSFFAYFVCDKMGKGSLFVCLFNPFNGFFGSEGHVALDRNPGTEYDTLLLRMI